MALDRDGILSKKRKATVKEVPFCGDTVNVRGMTGRERSAMEAATQKWAKELGVKPVEISSGMLLAYTLVDGDGQRLFRDDDALELSEYPMEDIDEALEEAGRLSGYGAAALREAKKNSGVARNGGHGADLPFVSSTAP